MAKNKRWEVSDIAWCELHQYMDNPPTLVLEDRHSCSFPIGSIDNAKQLITTLQEIIEELEEEQS